MSVAVDASTQAKEQTTKDLSVQAESKISFAPGVEPTKEELDRVCTQWNQHLGEILFSESAIQQKVKEMAAQISKDYAAILKPDEVLVCVPVLKGAFVFAADLLRHLTIPYEIDFLNVSSYGAGTETSGEVTLLSPLRTPLKGRHVLLIEDLMDTGLTLAWADKYLKAQEPASLRLGVLLHKHGRARVNMTLDYFGFHCPNKFVIGYGMDYAQQYRCLPYVCVLKPSGYAKKAE